MSLNYIVLSGCLPKDSEVRYTVAGKPVLEFSLEVQDDLDPENKQSIRVISRREPAVELQDLLKRGVRVAVEGQLVQRKIETDSGHRRKLPEIHMDHLTVLA